MIITNDIQRTFKIFVDFDGTISARDIGEALFYQFAPREEVNHIIECLLQGSLSPFRVWEELFAILPPLKESDFLTFIDSCPIDPAFASFAEKMHGSGCSITVVSDGFDYYITPFLARFGLQFLPVFSNLLSSLPAENGNSVFHPVFPHTDEECKECANCKRNHVLSLSGDDEYTAYIGNGVSDRCPSQFCDFIFAKDDLLRYCEKERIPYFRWRTFDDVMEQLTILMKRKNVKRRLQPQLKRRSVYMQG